MTADNRKSYFQDVLASAVLIIVGVLLLLGKLPVQEISNGVSFDNLQQWWPLILIGLGVALAVFDRSEAKRLDR